MWWILYFVPKNFLSFVVGRFVHIRWPAPLGPWLVEWFIKRYHVNMSEAKEASYNSIGELFTRYLKPGVRPICGASYVHPADSTLVQIQTIQGDFLVQAKGKTYSFKEFIKGTDQQVGEFYGGKALTYYLCPTDCHRVYSPMEGQINSCHYIPGRLWPVNPWAMEHISQLFSLNERVVTWIKTPRGPLVVVMVGATNVGWISLSFEKIKTNHKPFRRPLYITYLERVVRIQKAQELGAFHMGSTVIVLAAKGVIEMTECSLPLKVYLGQGFE